VVQSAGSGVVVGDGGDVLEDGEEEAVDVCETVGVAGDDEDGVV